MNIRMNDGTARCADHFDASTTAGMTDEPCLYCPTGVALAKATDPCAGTRQVWGAAWCDTCADKGIWHAATPAARHTPTRLPAYPLASHRAGLRANDPITLASALWILAQHGGTAHQSPQRQEDGMSCHPESTHPF